MVCEVGTGSPADLRVRRAEPADAPALAALARELNLHQGEPSEHFTRERALAHGFGPQPRFRTHLAELDGEIVGYAIDVPSYSTEYGVSGSYLEDLFVLERHRGRGIGRALLRAVATATTAEDGAFVWWCSKPWNEPAQAFYRRLGAIEERVIAHAIYGDALGRLLADEPATE
jgi:ribosomal protein S18 acetylase RimI-like enzyme